MLLEKQSIRLLSRGNIKRQKSGRSSQNARAIDASVSAGGHQGVLSAKDLFF